ncbi:Self-incompatibility protein [Parasponia andersonii]|uniref:S-protein homolog n=1 Tax=Parasponia andersonii TaxID=3476 RepID=A0A2P5AV11_PARAD|nr:Self-incompatibility protein [Parasponia andersonii]
MNTSTPLYPKHLVLRLELFVLFVFLIATNVTEAGLLYPKTEVSVTNYLQPDLNLTAHCKSKDDDLGVQVVPYGKKYTFTFQPSFWGNTLFFCGMRWNFSELKYFDIYDSARDNKICDKCKHYDWIIRAAGPCMFNSGTNSFDACYEWNKDEKIT